MLASKIDESVSLLRLGMSNKNAETQKRDLDVLYDKLKRCEKRIKEYMYNAVETKNAIGYTAQETEYLINTLTRYGSDAIEGKKESAIRELQNIEKQLKSGTEELKTIWSDYRAKKFSASLMLIKALKNVLDDDKRLDQLGDLSKLIEGKSIGDRKTVQDIVEFCKLTEELIESKKMDPDIQEFVKKLAMGKDVIYLCDITDEIFTWIKTNKLDKKIKISMKI